MNGNTMTIRREQGAETSWRKPAYEVVEASMEITWYWADRK